MWSSAKSAELQKSVVESKNFVIETGANPATDWIKLNSGQFVPMVVDYPVDMFNLLVNAVESKQLTPCDRAGVLLDCMSLLKSGRNDSSKILSILKGLRIEDDYVVWDVIEGILETFSHILQANKDVIKEFNNFASRLIGHMEPILNNMDQSHIIRLHKSIIFRIASKFSTNAKLKNDIKRRYAAWTINPVEGSPDLPNDFKGCVFKAILKSDQGPKEFEFLLETLPKFENNIDKTQVLASLGYVEDIKLKRRALEYSISGEVKLQDFFYVAASVAASGREGAELCWDFFKENFKTIQEIVKQAHMAVFQRFCEASCSRLITQDKLEDVKRFFKEHPIPDHQTKIEQFIEEIHGNVEFSKRMFASDAGKQEIWKSM
eukprot:GHVL01029228.1.p1 GENE.GHVL01029228.1~~GHVL01029228.1.p1  ORF type:complete len:376 (+),score=76.58 GHVL01029228.1:2-1129(+)